MSDTYNFDPAEGNLFACSVTSPSMTLTTEGGTVTVSTGNLDLTDCTVVTLTAAE